LLTKACPSLGAIDASPASKPYAGEQRAAPTPSHNPEDEIREPISPVFDSEIDLIEEESTHTCATVEDSGIVNSLLEELLLDQPMFFNTQILSIEPVRSLSADPNNMHPPKAFHMNGAGGRVTPRLFLINA
jgi:hypothetical protein